MLSREVEGWDLGGGSVAELLCPGARVEVSGF